MTHKIREKAYREGFEAGRRAGIALGLERALHICDGCDGVLGVRTAADMMRRALMKVRKEADHED